MSCPVVPAFTATAKGASKALQGAVHAQQDPCTPADGMRSFPSTSLGAPSAAIAALPSTSQGVQEPLSCMIIPGVRRRAQGVQALALVKWMTLEESAAPT